MTPNEPVVCDTLVGVLRFAGATDALRRAVLPEGERRSVAQLVGGPSDR
jgi:hypothetical protein